MSRRGNWISSIGNQCHESFIWRQTKKYLPEEKRQRTRFHIRLHQTYTRREIRNNVTVKQHTNKQPLSLSPSPSPPMSPSIQHRTKHKISQWTTHKCIRTRPETNTSKKEAKPNQKDANTDQEQQGWTKILKSTVTIHSDKRDKEQ